MPGVGGTGDLPNISQIIQTQQTQKIKKSEPPKKKEEIKTPTFSKDNAKIEKDVKSSKFEPVKGIKFESKPKGKIETKKTEQKKSSQKSQEGRKLDITSDGSRNQTIRSLNPGDFYLYKLEKTFIGLKNRLNEVISLKKEENGCLINIFNEKIYWKELVPEDKLEMKKLINESLKNSEKYNKKVEMSEDILGNTIEEKLNNTLKDIIKEG